MAASHRSAPRSGIPPHSPTRPHTALSGQRPELPCSGDGLRAAGDTQLPEYMADVLLHGVQCDHQLFGDRSVRVAGGQQRQHLLVPGAERLDQAGHGDRATPRGREDRHPVPSKPAARRRRNSRGTASARQPLQPSAHQQGPQQRRERSALVNEHLDVALRCGKRERLRKSRRTLALPGAASTPSMTNEPDRPPRGSCRPTLA